MSSPNILNENKTYWSGRAEGYSRVNQEELAGISRKLWKKAITAEISSAISKPISEISVLEVGTGPGFFAILLTEEGYKVTAIDLTPNMLEEARKNAGPLAEKISFMEMNAEALTFPDQHFDVIITRNLTWNLPHPETAYGEWHRVLKNGGLLLNFDANWYNYLFDEEAQQAFENDRITSAELGFEDQNVGENFDQMEEIARKIPLSSLRRPAWDLDVLEKLGMQVQTDETIWQKVWTEQEKTNFASTPMFMIRAIKSN